MVRRQGRSGEGTGPVTPMSFQVLVALAGGALHGYGIIKDIEAREGPGSVPSTGALYLALQRMEESGLVEESPVPEPGLEQDGRRRYYRLTALGRRVAEGEAKRLADLLGTAADRRLMGGSVLSGLAPQGGRHGE